MRNISNFFIFYKLFHEPLVKWVLQDATCDNYFIVKCLFKSNELTVILLTNCIELAQYHLKLTKYLPGYISKALTAIFPHFDLDILYSVHLLGNQLSLAINLFSNVLFQTFGYFWNTYLLSSWFHCVDKVSIKFRFCETFTVTNFMARFLLIV